MAKPTTYRGSHLLVKISDGGDPEEFSAPCGLTTRGLSRTAETNSTSVPDCDDPDAPAWTEAEVGSQSWSVSGSGVLAAESVAVWDEWFASGEARNVQIDLGTGAAGRRYTGRALLTSYEVTGERGNKVQVSVTQTGDGPLVAADLA
ncbi:phage tail tube protein [Xanthobacter sp. TB0139]|uniref:phage tail tube protein n=1 Tax=Xanthobacter sp. TB0139 TaxID=3459178 RepID=UPI004039F26B